MSVSPTPTETLSVDLNAPPTPASFVPNPESAQTQHIDWVNGPIDQLPMLEEEVDEDDDDVPAPPAPKKRRILVQDDDDTIEGSTFTPSGSSGYETVESAETLDLDDPNVFGHDPIEIESSVDSNEVIDISSSSDDEPGTPATDPEWVPKRK